MPHRLHRAPRRPLCNLRHLRGFVMLEALVAILLFATALLGILGLQTNLTRAQTESAIRSEAANLAQELIGLMWANLSQLDGFDLSSGDCTATACKAWLAKTRSMLPDGAATVTVASLGGSAGGDVDITVTWRLPSGEARKYMTRSTLAQSHTP